MKLRRFTSILLLLSTFFVLSVPAYAGEAPATSSVTTEVSPLALIRATKYQTVHVQTAVANFDAKITVTALINDSTGNVTGIESTSAAITKNENKATITYNTKLIDYTPVYDGTTIGSLEGSLMFTVTKNGNTAQAFVKITATSLGNNTFNLAVWQT